MQGKAFSTYGRIKLSRISRGIISVGDSDTPIKTRMNKMKSKMEGFFEKNQIEAPAIAMMNVGDSAM